MSLSWLGLRRRNREQAALLHTLLRRFPAPLLLTGPDGLTRPVNPLARDLLGPEGLTLPPGSDPVEIRVTRPDGTAGDLLISPVPDEGGSIALWTAQDVSAHRVYEESLHHAAYHDELTGLPNRVSLWQHLRVFGAGPAVTIHIDLDGFRAVNETHGHQAGDELLIGVAHRLRDAAYAGTRTAPHRAITARLGGDDFAVLLPGADAEAADRLIPALRAAFDRPFPTGAGSLTARATFRVSTA
ncbi:diguanylate cyclase domain-containing protein [Dactylosporangium sp. CS-033363]|uniref:diguanylate cyclase domain-containing protein n=1 Tax=Dactylosporangium sp. CS-033363 TaxID=3239935 RepID=UPI003D917637